MAKNIKEQLINIGADKLADLLIEFADSYKDVKKRVNTCIASQNEDPKKLIAIINRELNTLKKAKSMIFYDKVSEFSERLDQLRLSISKELAQKSIKEALHAIETFFPTSAFFEA